MAVQLKQRLIGAIVLLALAVLALPMLLDRTSSRVTQLQSQIPVAGQPVKPVVPKVVTEAQLAAQAQANLPEPEVAPVPPVPETPPEPVEPPAPVELTEAPVASVNLTGKKPVTTVPNPPPAIPSIKAEPKKTPVTDAKPVLPVTPASPTPATQTKPLPKPDSKAEARDKQLSAQARQALAVFDDESQLSGSTEGTVVKVIPKKAASPRQSAWVMQLAGFKNTDNAEKLVTQLQRKGYRAFVDTSMPGLARVMVGPETDRSRLDSQLPRIEQDTSLKGMVRPYTP